MKSSVIGEPQLEFGTGQHVCPRAGIAYHSVYDVKMKARRERILIAGIGTSDGLSDLGKWLYACRDTIPPKAESRQPRLFPGFCGFRSDMGFHCEFQYEDEITRTVNNSEVKNLLKIKDWDRQVTEAADLYYRHAKFLAQNRVVDVIVCVLPEELYKVVVVEKDDEVEEDIETDRDDEERDRIEMNFRRLLKARCMHLGKPIQIVRQVSLGYNVLAQQDDATKAWNFCTALYYKANQTAPWRLEQNPNRPSVCYVGIGFFRSRDKKSVQTSLAQVFDELGNGVILRGTPAELDKDDRRPYLNETQAHDLMIRALDEYETALQNSPSRVVIHKTSNFRDAEVSGFSQALNAARVRAKDFVTIHETPIRLFRSGFYPPLRGTHVELSRERHLLFTRGSVPYYGTYPGLYIPQPLEIRVVQSDESAETICREILALTKMNWNNTQFDGKYPITILCSRNVGRIMKYLDPEKHEEPQIRYSFYM